MSKNTPNKSQTDKSNTKGDLVRIDVNLGNHDDALSPMVDELVDTDPLVSSRWSVGIDDANSWLREYENDAHISALQLPCAGGCHVGVLKMGTSGHCTLFLRIKRGHVTTWASRNAVKEGSAIALRHSMPINNAKKLLDASRTIHLTDGEVHHPHTLSILLCMTKLSWMKRGKGMPIPTIMRSFTVVAMPPPLVVIEKCLCLLGWNDTFIKDNKAASAKGLRPVNADVWGEGSKTMINTNYTALFIQGTREIQKNVGRTLIVGIVPKLNQCAMKSDRVMRNMLKVGGVEIGEMEVLVGNAADVAPDSGHIPAFVLPAGMKEIVVQSGDDSDDSDDRDDVPLAVKNVFPVAKSPTPARSKPAKRSKTNGSEDEGDDINQVALEDAELSDVDSTSEEDDDDDDDDDDSSDENDDGDDDRASPCSRSSEGKEVTTKKRGRRLESPAAPGNGREATILLNGDLNVTERDSIPLQQALRAMVAPCCAHMKEWDKNSSEHTTQVDEQRMRRIRLDVDLMEKSTTPIDIVASVIGLVSNLANAHTDPFKGETVTMNKKTLDGLNLNRNTNTADIDKVIKILGSVRDREESPRLPQTNQNLHE